MRSWKKRWIAELDKKLPTLRDDVKNAPIGAGMSAANEEKSPSVKNIWERFAGWISAHKKRFFACVATCAAAVIALIAVLPNLLIGSPEKLTAVAIEINPTAVFSVNEKGNVVAVIAGNEDADIILSDDARAAQMRGRPVEEAAQVFVEYAESLGFIDFTAQDSLVTVDGCESLKLADDVSAALQTYLTQKGAQTNVRTEKLSLADFCATAGVVADKVSELGEKVKGSERLATVRAAAGKTVDQLQTFYKTVVSYDDLRGSFYTELETNIDKICANSNDVVLLFVLNTEIMCDFNNPNLISLKDTDYWTVKETADQSNYEDSFAEKMKEMEESLAQYKTAYGVEIVSLEQLEDIRNEYVALPVETIVEALGNFTELFFSQYVAGITAILENVGVDFSFAASLCELPQNAEQYAKNIQTYFNKQYDLKLAEKITE